MGLGVVQGVGNTSLGEVDMQIQWTGDQGQVMVADMEINGGRCRGSVPQKQLDMVQAGSGLNQMSGYVLYNSLIDMLFFPPHKCCC
jgi:hypothetical protein